MEAFIRRVISEKGFLFFIVYLTALPQYIVYIKNRILYIDNMKNLCYY